MLMKEFRDQFLFYYGLECQKRNKPEIAFMDRQFLLMYSNAMMDISERLKMLRDFVSISLTPVTIFTEYTLAQDYGGFIKAELFDNAGNKITEIDSGSYDEIDTSSNNSGQPTKCIIYPDGLNYKLVLVPNTNITGSLKLHYLKVTDLYAPAKTTQSTPTEGANPLYSLDALSAVTAVPDRYMQGAIFHMIGQIYDDVMQKYEYWMIRMKANGAGTIKKSTNYKLGGIK